jgi:hypothetical protein
MFLGANDEPPDTVFAYDAVYFDTSAYIHSAPAALRQITTALVAREHFDLSVGVVSTEQSERAMGVTIVSLALSLAVLDEYAGLGIGDAIEEVRTKMRPAVA